MGNSDVVGLNSIMAFPPTSFHLTKDSLDKHLQNKHVQFFSCSFRLTVFLYCTLSNELFCLLAVLSYF